MHAARPPHGNVLFITVDQFRGDCLSAMGHPLVKTPSLDRLAGEGVLFTNHWAQATPCGPSRACLYTGTYLHQNRSVLNGTPLDARFANVALEARAAGWDPVLFGYTDSSIDPRTVEDDDDRLRTYEGVLPGFRAVLDFPFEPLTPWIGWLADRGYPIPDDPQEIFRGDQAFPGADSHESSWAPPIYSAEHSETAFLTNELLEWLDTQNDEPWFVHASYLRPHTPYPVVAPFHDLYDPADVPLPTRASTREVEGASHPFAELALSVIGAPADEAKMRQIRATYYGMIAELDHHLGRVFDWLDESGRAADTLVVLTSDHGDQLGDHWLMEKLGYWDASYHVPLIVRDPRVPIDRRGGRVAAFTEHVDVMPTMLDWMGIDIPSQCDGRSLLPFLAGTDVAEPADWRQQAHWQWDFRSPSTHAAEDALGLTMEQCSLDVIRDHRWKYVHFAGMAPLLFDLRNDPGQLCNLADDVTYASVVAEYAGKLLSWRMRHGDRTLTGTELTRSGAVTRVDPRVG